MIKKYNQYNESLLDKMVGPTEEEIISQGLDVFLKICIEQSDIVGVKKAIDLGVDLNDEKQIHLYSACVGLNPNIEIVKLLLENGIESDASILLKLYEYKSFIILDLIEKHYNFNYIDEMKRKVPKDYLIYGFQENSFDIVKDAFVNGVPTYISFIYYALRYKCSIKIVDFILFMGDDDLDQDLNLLQAHKKDDPVYFTDELMNRINLYNDTNKFKKTLK